MQLRDITVVVFEFAFLLITCCWNQFSKTIIIKTITKRRMAALDAVVNKIIDNPPWY